MTCRHAPGDPNCSSHPDRRREAEAAYAQQREEDKKKKLERQKIIDSLPPTPDSENYEVEDYARVGPHIVLKVAYPNCAKCAYEGKKIMVFLNVSEKEVITWKKIDPHFRGEPSKPVAKRESPSPAARFPASNDGWMDAVAYAKSKVPGTFKQKPEA